MQDFDQFHSFYASSISNWQNNRLHYYSCSPGIRVAIIFNLRSLEDISRKFRWIPP